MSFQLRSRRYVDKQAVTVGQCWPAPGVDLNISATLICQTKDPDVFAIEVRCGSHSAFEVGPFESHSAVTSAVADEVPKRLASVLGQFGQRCLSRTARSRDARRGSPRRAK